MVGFLNNRTDLRPMSRYASARAYPVVSRCSLVRKAVLEETNDVAEFVWLRAITGRIAESGL